MSRPKEVVVLAAIQATLMSIFFQHACTVVASEAPASVKDRERSVRVLVDFHPRMHEVRA